MAFSKVTVTARWIGADDTPASGTVSFKPAATMQQAGESIVPVAAIKATLDDTGAISVQLYATDDPATLPVGNSYHVVELINGGRRDYDITLPHGSSTVDLRAVAPTVAGPAVYPYALQSALTAEEAARIDGDADTLAEAEAYTNAAIAAVAGGSDANFVFQQATPASTWTITHNLGKRPSVTVVDAAGVQIWADVEHLSSNSVAVTFNAATAGAAYLN